MHLLCVGGGSVGHIAPSVAVWQSLKKLSSESTVHFVCSPRPADAPFLEKQNLPYTVLDAPRLSWRFPFTFPAAYRQAKQILKKEQPDLILSKGGYVSVPLCLAARRLNIPIVLHESDVVSGYANRVVALLAARVCTGWPMGTSEKLIHTGNPIRTEITQGNREQGLKCTGFKNTKPVLIVLGGSQGSLAINHAVQQHLTALLEICNIIHLTGEGKDVHLQHEGYWSTPFAYDELPHLYALAKIALTRASSGALAELAANHIACITVPLRGVGHDHQQKNAERLAAEEAAILLDQTRLQSDLVPILTDLIHTPEQQEKLAKNLNVLQKSDAANRVAQVLHEVLAGEHGDQ